MTWWAGELVCCGVQCREAGACGQRVVCVCVGGGGLWCGDGPTASDCCGDNKYGAAQRRLGRVTGELAQRPAAAALSVMAEQLAALSALTGALWCDM